MSALVQERSFHVNSKESSVDRKDRVSLSWTQIYHLLSTKRAMGSLSHCLHSHKHFRKKMK